MRMQMSGHHVEVTPSLRSYLEKKIGRVARRFDHLIDIRCILSVDKLRHKAESTVQLSGSRLHAEAVAEDMYAAIDALSDKIAGQVRRHKERARDHHAAEGRRHG